MHLVIPKDQRNIFFCKLLWVWAAPQRFPFKNCNKNNIMLNAFVLLVEMLFALTMAFCVSTT